MARPIIDWDPRANAELVTEPGAGGVTLNSDDLEKYDLAVGVSAFPRQTASTVLYTRRAVAERGTAPEDGLRHRAYDVNPTGITFWVANPATGEPYPLDIDDAISTALGIDARYIQLGQRLPLRGWLGGATAGLDGQVEVTWGDGTTRAAADTTRGPFTGLVVSAYDLDALDCHHLMYAVHGKRKADTNWLYRGGYILDPFTGSSSTGESTATKNAVDTGKVRIGITGTGPWNIVTQYWDGAAWQTLDSRSVTLTSGALLSSEVAMRGWLFAGQGGLAPAGSPWGTLTDVWFPEVVLEKFEPWVVNLVAWDARDLDDLLFPFMGAPSKIQDVVSDLALPDLMHHPFGSLHEPVSLRKADSDLGLAVEVDQLSGFVAVGTWDLDGIGLDTYPKQRPLLTTDTEWAGIDAPFSAVVQLKLIGDQNPSKWYVIAFGDTARTPSATDNGVALYWQDGTLRGKIYDDLSGDYVIVEAEFDVDHHSDIPLELGIAWSGARGVDCGYEDYTLRILVNGEAVAVSGALPDALVATTDIANVGFHDSFSGWAGLLGRCRVYPNALTDDEIRRAFEEPTSDDLDFDVADTDAEPGQAEGWEWKAGMISGGRALFRQSPWTGPQESFDWFGLYPSVVNGTAETFDLSALTTGAVAAVNPATDQITVNGVDWRELLPAGSNIRITGSTGLDAYWTVSTVAYSAGNSVITVDEDVLSSTADGQVEVPPILTVEVNQYDEQFTQLWDVYFEDAAAATADEVAAVLNSYIQHSVTRARAGLLTIRSETQGFYARIQVTGGDANTVLSFPTSEVWGVDDVGWFDTWDDVTAITALFGDGTPAAASSEGFEWTDWYDTLEEAGALTAGNRSWYGQLHTHDITDVDTGTDDFTVAGDVRSAFPSGTTIQITGSTANDGQYVVLLTFLDGPDTVIRISGSIPDATVDGQLGPIVWSSAVESFDEGWDFDPISSDFEAPSVNGRLYSDELTFPLTIRTDKNRLFVYSSIDGAVHEFQLTGQEYADAAALSAELSTKWSTALPTSKFSWRYSGNRIWFGWDGSSTMTSNEVAYFLFGPGTDADRDVRSIIGLYGLSPSGEPGRVVMPAGYYDGDDAADWTLEGAYQADPWSYLEVRTETDLQDAFEEPVAADRELAVFDVAEADDDYRERFKPDTWGGAAWIGPATHGGTPDETLTSGFTAAIFDTDGTPESVEDFEDGWP